RKSPSMRGPEGRPSKLQPSPEGLGYQSQADLSAVGAALNLGQLASLSLGAKPRDLQFRGPLLETRNTILNQNCHLACPGAPWDLRFISVLTQTLIPSKAGTGLARTSTTQNTTGFSP
ncbi:MAG: hypothetical protein WCD57_09255, partial [Acidobacteriaceae bacterium]